MMRRPVVQLFEFSSCGVSITWSLPSARTVALKAIACIIARFVGIPEIVRLELDPEFDQTAGVSATSIEQFAATAPTIIRYERRREANKLRLNGQDTGFTIIHLDQSTSGFHCQLSGSCTDEARERFYGIVLEVLREYEAKTAETDFDFGAYS